MPDLSENQKLAHFPISSFTRT